MGVLGERLAARLLFARGMDLVEHNLAVGKGEIDLLMSDGGAPVVVEVRAITGEGDPIDAIGLDKREQVRRLARHLRPSRVDLVGIGIRPTHIIFHWVPDAA
ncbi:MAG: YraN family protein [Acidimicrobiia bacterium]